MKTNYSRRPTQTVKIGNVTLGSGYPICVQSMLNTNTNDTEACVNQTLEIVEAGGEIVRITTQGVKEAANTANIKAELVKRGCNVPLVADVHFNPKAATEAALHIEKVRINPGNYANTLEEINEKFTAFLHLCKEHGTAIRIGVNHGSLHSRIVSQYGDTPEGMSISCLEFLRICKRENFENVVISVKASNTRVMVQTVRQLVRRMDEEDLHFPLHLGVTEAGEGEDGRIKSAVGIGALLLDGYGDTIRVSLSENPANEIPVAKALVKMVEEVAKAPLLPECSWDLFDGEKYSRRKTVAVGEIGGTHLPVVLKPSEPVPAGVILLNLDHPNAMGQGRLALAEMEMQDVHQPVILKRTYHCDNLEELQLRAAMDLGSFFIDGLADGLCIADPHFPEEVTEQLAYSILQASRARMSKTEYISCPGCGRTLYDIQGTIAKIKAKTNHLKSLKIGIMGCIVNGPGEMADADYGYVGAGRGKISLYKGQNCILKNIPEEEAVDRLIELIKECGDWEEKKC